MDLQRTDTFCTLCLSKERNLLHVFENNERDIQLPTVIRELLHFEVVQGGCIPWKICRNCFIKLKDFQHFKSHARKCKEYLEHTLLHGRQHLDSTLEATLKTEEDDEDEIQSNESFTIEDVIVPKMEDMEDVPDKTEGSHTMQTAVPVLKPVEVFVNVDMAVASSATLEERDPLGNEDGDVMPSALIMKWDEGVSREEDSTISTLPTGNSTAFGGVKLEMGDDAIEMSAMTIEESSARWRSSNESHPTETTDPVLKPVEVFVNVDMALASSATLDPLRDEDGCVMPSALITKWDEGVSREEDSTFSPPPTGNAIAFGGVKQEMGDDVMETSAMTIEESSANWRSSNVILTRCANVVRAAVDGGGENSGVGGVGGFQETMEVEKNSDALTVVGHHSSGRLKQDTTVSEATISRRMKRRLSSNSRDNDEVPKEGIGSTPCKSSGEQFCERSEAFTQRNAGMRIESEEDSETLAGCISNGPITTDGKSKGDNYHCNECGRGFRTKSVLRRHVKVHFETEVSECGDCHLKFSERSEYDRHKSVQHGNGTSKRRPQRGVAVVVGGESKGKGKVEKRGIPPTCHICEKVFSQTGQLTMHLKCVHLKERNFSCDVCGKAFGRKYVLKIHRMLHYGVKPYACSHCQKSFTQSGTLKAHILSVHTLEKPHACGECGKTFSLKHHLKDHMLVHTRERPHACDVCSKRFSQKKYLKLHVLIHTNERPHACNVCSKTFIRRSRLLLHMSKHTG